MRRFDGMTFDGQLLLNIEALLILQLITSGIAGKEIAGVLGYATKRDFLKDFPWATWEGR
jgi:hypothetical protein